MSFEVPPSQFRMDIEGRVLERLDFNTPAYLMDMQVGFLTTKYGQVVCGAAEQIQEEGLRGLLMKQAFCAAGAIACDGFWQSDAPQYMQEKTMKELAYGLVPAKIFTNNKQDTLNAFTDIACEGIAAHREFRHSIAHVARYYLEVSQDGGIGRMAELGAGFTIFQLDKAWQKCRDISINHVVWQPSDAEIRAFLNPS